MGETLEYSAQLVDAITPVLEKIVAAVNGVTDQMVKLGETISASMQTGTDSTTKLATATDDLAGTVAQAAASVEQEATALGTDSAAAAELQTQIDALAASIAAQTSATDAAAAATDVDTASTDAATVSIDANTVSVAANTAANEANVPATKKAGNSTKSLGEQFKALQMPLLVAGGLLAAIGTTAVIVGAKYESAMSVVQALTGQTAQQMAIFNQQILAMAPALGASPTQMAQGLYYVLSAGVKASDAMGVLKVVTEASAAGMVNAATDADALTTALNSYAAGSDQAMHYQDMLLVAVRDGKTTMQELASAIGKAAVTGHAAGYSFDQVAAAMSTMTLSGDTARNASNQLAFLMRALGINVDATAKAARKMGLSFDESKFKTMDLYGQLQYLMQITGGNKAELLKLTGGAPGFQAAMMLMSGGGKQFAGILKDMGNSAGMTASAFATHEQTMAAVWDHLKATAEVVLIKISQALEPVVKGIMEHIMPALESFGNWVSQHGPLIAQIFMVVAAAIGGMLVAALGVATAAFISTYAAAIGIAAVVGALIAGVILLVQHWNDVIAAFNSSKGPLGFIHTLFVGIANVWNTYILPTLKNLWTALSSQFTPILNTLKDVLKNDLIPAWNSLKSAFEQMLPALKFIGMLIGGTLVVALVLLVSVIKGIFMALGPIIQGAAMVIGGAIKIIAGVIQVLSAIIGGVFTFLKDLFTGNFSKLGSDLKNIWNGIVSGLGQIIGGLWEMIKGLFVAGIGAVWNFLKGFVSGIGDFIGGFVNNILSAIGGFFSGIWNTIVGWGGDVINFFVGLWNAITSGVGDFFSAVGSLVSDGVNAVLGFFGKLFDTIKNLITSGWNAIKRIFQTAINFVVGLFKWLYDHNYYFKALVDFIRTIFSQIGAWLSNTWNTIVTTLVGIWNTISGAATTAWNAVTGAISTAVQAVWNWLVSAWNTITGALSTAWKAIETAAQAAWKLVQQYIIKPVQDAWNWVTSKVSSLIGFLAGVWRTIGNDARQLWTNFTNAISSTWNNVTGWIHDHIVKPITDTLSKLADLALQWGKNMVQGLINGITGWLGHLWDSIKGIASGIAKFLGFHSPPPEGPLADSDTYGPNFMKMYASTMLGAMPAIDQATRTVAARISTGLAPKITPLGVSASGTSGGVAPIGGSSGGVRELHIHVEPKGSFRDGMALMNGAAQSRLARQIADALAKEKSLQVKANYGYSGA